jgi:superoxide dismutase, Fe-Mn family
LTEAVPLLGIDVWEHAYYYLYGPARAEYLKQIFTVINWKNVSERYAKAQQAK